MQKLRYDLCTQINIGSDTAPIWTQKLAAVEMEYNEKNLEIAKDEAYQGQYEIVEVMESEAPMI